MDEAVKGWIIFGILIGLVSLVLWSIMPPDAPAHERAFVPVYINGSYFYENGTKILHAQPILQINPFTGQSVLIVQDSALIRRNQTYGEFVDLLHHITKGLDVPDEASTAQVFSHTPKPVTIQRGEAIHRYSESPFELIIYTPLAVKKIGPVWRSEPFVTTLLPDALFSVLWGVGEFPLGSLTDVTVQIRS